MAAIRDAEGTPLLSWRVAVLPYIDEIDLYRRFRMDEPWNSPHNVALLKEMPAQYANPTRPHVSREGKTVYQVPTGPNTLFPAADDAELIERAGGMIAKGLLFRDLVDGSSNTFMVVEVAPDHAVPWTKPADWATDVDDLMAALRQEDRTGFTTAFADGHARFVRSTSTPRKFAKRPHATAARRSTTASGEPPTTPPERHGPPLDQSRAARRFSSIPISAAPT